MAKLTYDVSGVEKDPALPKPNVYKVKIISCVDAKPQGKNRRLEVQYEIVGGDSKGYKLRDWIQIDNAEMEWQFAQFIRALGLKDKGSLDPAKLVGKTLFVRTTIQNDEEWGPQARVRQRLSAEDAEEQDTGGDEDDENLEDEDGEDGGEEDESESGDDEDEDWTAEELAELNLDELKEAAEELEVDVAATIKGKKKASDKKSALTAAILEAQESEDEDEEGGDDEGDDENWTQEELEELDNDDLREAASEFEDVTVPKKLTAAAKKKVIAAILEAQGGEEDEGDEEEGDEDDAPDYSAMDPDELKAECKKRGLPTKGTKAILVKRLEKDDAADPV